MCLQKDEIVANRFGRPFYRKRKTFQLKDLKPGDHIVQERLKTYWHHMIVESVEEAASEPINVIHYYDGKAISSGFGCKVRRNSFEYTQTSK